MERSLFSRFSFSRTQWLKAFLVLYYLVGLAGLINVQTNSLFVVLIPFSLLLTYILLGISHNSPVSTKELLLFATVILGGFIIEVIGVKTGVVFGPYSYSDGLGWSLLDTPLIIGLNWLFLTYCTYAITAKTDIHWVYKAVLSSFLMVFYDLFLEQVAPKLNMWHWQNEVIPLQNYLAWFIIAFGFQLLFNRYKILIVNELALFLFSIQLLFFMVLSLTL